jgi:hypothetical protein
VARIATITLNGITSIGEVIIVSLGAKGFCLHEGSRARSLGSKSITITSKKKTKSAENYVSKSLDNIQAKNQRIFTWDKPLCINAKLHHRVLDSHDEFVEESRPA